MTTGTDLRVPQSVGQLRFVVEDGRIFCESCVRPFTSVRAMEPPILNIAQRDISLRDRNRVARCLSGKRSCAPLVERFADAVVKTALQGVRHRPVPAFIAGES